VTGIMELIHEVNPYKDFDQKGFMLDLQGWNSNSKIFYDLINEKRPKLIIEVGTWKGCSAIHMAKYIKNNKIDCQILCVDTWLGGLEHWLQKNIKTRPWYQYLNLKNGYPSLYYQFIYNVIKSELQDIIVPFPNTSLIAARFLKRNDIKADLIYIDGSHDELDVYLDLVNYFDLLTDDGIIFGDDYAYQSVQSALEKFCLEKEVSVVVKEKQPWVIRKAKKQ